MGARESETMSTDRIERRPFLHSTSDNDSDAEREEGWAEHLGQNGKQSTTSSVAMIAESESELKRRVSEIEEYRRRSYIPEGEEISAASTNEEPVHKGKESTLVDSFVVHIDEHEQSKREAEPEGYTYKPKSVIPQYPLSDSDSDQETLRDAGRGRDAGSRRSFLKQQVPDEVPVESQREIEREKGSPVNRGRRSSRLGSATDVDLEAQLDVARERARASNRRISRVISPEPDVDSDFDVRDDDLDRAPQRPILQRRPSIAAQVGERVPPEWALLLLGCFLGLASGLSVVIFNNGVRSDFRMGNKTLVYVMPQYIVMVFVRCQETPITETLALIVGS